MKVLTLHGFFKLPDDFDGSEADAIRLFADYHEKQEAAQTQVITATSEHTLALHKALWVDFVDAIREGKSATLCISVSESKLNENE